MQKCAISAFLRAKFEVLSPFLTSILAYLHFLLYLCNLILFSMRKVLILILCSVFLVPVWGAKRKLHTIGDSTMSEYKPSATPKRGWGMYLQAFFKTDSVKVNNRGKSGASTRTFYETEALWPSVKSQMEAGDYLIIQFAHNDEKCKGEDVYVKNADLRAVGMDTLTDMRGTEPNTTYKEYLGKFIHEARELGVTPILMAPICRAYFLPDGTINDEGRHKLGPNKDYVRCMREVAEEMDVPFLDMTERSRALYEKNGQNYCMRMFFNCGDKTHTGAAGGMAIAQLANDLITECDRLAEMRPWMNPLSMQRYEAYAQAIEEKGKMAAFKAQGISFKQTLKPAGTKNLKLVHHEYMPTSELWPAGEIDEVANRYVEFLIAAEKKRALVIDRIVVPVCARGGNGMNIHINYGFGNQFRDVTTAYENTALKKGQPILVTLDQPILVPAGEILHIRVLPWYDSNGKPQKGKGLELGDVQVSGKKLN